MMNRTENISRLAEEDFDLCIIGGGVSGAGCALDAALKGLKVALIEKTDFASETSSRSTKLIHGGVRYLEQAFKKLDLAQLRQVRHGLEERHILLQNAPHLAHPLGLITPVFSWWEGLYFTIGLKIYDWIAGKKGHLPASRWLSKKETLEKMPGLNKEIHSAVLYYDGQMNDARYCLALIQSAADLGAMVANHLELTEFKKDGTGKISGAYLKDRVSDGPPIEIKARRFLNCTGPYADQIRQLANPELPFRIQPSKGVHLLLPLEILQSKWAMLIPKTKDGRMVFAVPFEGALLLGTTDEPYTALEKEPVLEARELDFLIETLQPFVAQQINKAQVSAGFGGIRPLLKAQSANSNAKQTKSMLRDHEVEFDPVSGLSSLMGGKWTTYRLMAQDAIREICALLDQNEAESMLNPVRPNTAQYPLAGSNGFSADSWKNLQEKYGLDSDVCQHLSANYGSLASLVLELIPEDLQLKERILPGFPYLKAEIVFAVRNEMATTIRDFMARRIRLELLNWQAAKQATPVVAEWMGKTLAWPVAKQKALEHEYVTLIDSFIQSSKQH